MCVSNIFQYVEENTEDIEKIHLMKEKVVLTVICKQDFSYDIS